MFRSEKGFPIIKWSIVFISGLAFLAYTNAYMDFAVVVLTGCCLCLYFWVFKKAVDDTLDWMHRR
jgi:hypothetical protein